MPATTCATQSPAPLTTAPVVRSQFVTVTAWTLIALCSVATVVALIMAAVMQFLVLNDKTVHTIFKMMLDDAFASNTPPVALFLLDHAGMIGTLVGLSFILHLLVAVGLLQRKNWARLGTIGFLAASIVLTIAGGIGFHFLLEGLMRFALKHAEGDQLRLLQHGLSGDWIGSLVMTVLSVAPLALLIWRLLAPDIRREFIPPP